MIRRFFTLIIFTATILLAAFGQNLFGQKDIDHWAHRVRQEGPRHVQIALQETDKALAQLSPNAGDMPVCWADDRMLKHMTVNHTGV